MDHLPRPSLLSGNWPARRELIQGCLSVPRTGKGEKADRRIGKSESKAILQHIGVFVLVCSGKDTFFLYPLSCIPRCDGRRHEEKLTPPYQP